MAKVDLIVTKYQNNIDDLHYEDYKPMLRSLKEQTDVEGESAILDFTIELVNDMTVVR